jgi:hypothetical protein
MMLDLSKDGGPAFPMSPLDTGNGEQIIYTGMSLRDWFAGQALSLMSRPDYRLFRNDGESMTETTAASNAYLIADAMLAERAKEPQ